MLAGGPDGSEEKAGRLGTVELGLLFLVALMQQLPSKFSNPMFLIYGLEQATESARAHGCCSS